MGYCTQCGTNIPDGARFCPGCGKSTEAASPPADDPSRPSMPEPPLAGRSPPLAPPEPATRPSWMVPAMVVLAILIIGLLLWPQRQRADRAQSGATSTSIDAPVTPDDGRQRASGTTSVSSAALDSAYFSDHVRARQIYPGPVRVTGTIATTLSPSAEPSLSLEGRTRFNYVIANFEDEARSRLAAMMKGEVITFSCDSVTSVAGTTILQNCLL